MSPVSKGNRSSERFSETAVHQSGSSMHFWGVCCESGKLYAQVVGQRFRITMAVLDPKSYNNDETKRIVTVMVLQRGIEYLLCVLKHGEIHQVPLNLIFDKGENVKFKIEGCGKVYLSGYQLTESESDVLNDESGYLCPLVEEVKQSKKDMGNISSSSIQTEPERKPRKYKLSDEKRKNLSKMVSELLNSSKYGTEDDSEDSEDEDFNLDELSEDSEDEESSDEEDEEDEIDPEEIRRELLDIEESEDSSEPEQMQSFRGETQMKRKQEKIQTKECETQKGYQDSRPSSSSEKSEDIICIEEEGSDKVTSSGMDNASTPMPQTRKRPIEESDTSGKKSKKKKKNLSEISNISNSSTGEQKVTPQKGLSTPKSSKPVVKLEGGVEIQDLVVGKGPLATNGKMLHVYFVGRLPDNTIFDSRLPGKKPFSFKLGAGQVIKGWDVAFTGMRVGGKRKIRVPPNMGYGKVAQEGIPPKSTLSFIVELQNVS